MVSSQWSKRFKRSVKSHERRERKRILDGEGYYDSFLFLSDIEIQKNREG